MLKRNLRRIPALFTSFILLLLVLSACNTASNMGHEVSGWLNRDKSPNTGAAPQQVIGQEARELQNMQSGAYLGAGPVKVALLLPLSGDKASLGKSFRDAAEMAVMDVGGKGFELLPKDTRSDSASAAGAAREAVAQGAQIIIGPVFSSMVPAVREAAPNLPILSLSNDVNAAGGNVYVMGFAPTEQVIRIADFMKGQGVRRVGVILPATSYGDLVMHVLRQTGLEIVATESYQKNRKSIETAVTNIAARKADIDGIFIPDGGAALGWIAQTLFKEKITAKKFPIFGTGLWDEQDTSNSVALIGGYYPAPDPKARLKFFERFKANTSYSPLRLSTLSYDATALAAVLASRGADFSQASIESPSGFMGLDGVFRFNGNRAERLLAVMQVSPAGAKTVEDAAARF